MVLAAVPTIYPMGKPGSLIRSIKKCEASTLWIPARLLVFVRVARHTELAEDFKLNKRTYSNYKVGNAIIINRNAHL